MYPQTMNSRKVLSLPLISGALLALVSLGPLNGREPINIAQLAEIETKVQKVATKASPAVVVVTHTRNKGIASGSGCVISPSGIILTAAHVVGDAKTLDVVFPDMKKCQAKVLGADYIRDTALAIITEPGEFPFVELGDSKNLTVGDMTVALGHPGGFDSKRKPPVRFGRIFNLDHNRFISTDCTVIVGDSGGPLLDLEGRVIGVHSSVSKAMIQNNHTPVEAVRSAWDRLILGENIGELPKAPPSLLSNEELHGLNVDAFREEMRQDAILGENGRATYNPKEIAKRLLACGMQKDAVEKMKDDELVSFMLKAIGSTAHAAPSLPKIPPAPDESPTGNSQKKPGENPTGFDQNKFRQLLITGALEHGGKLNADAALLAKWLQESGMSKEQTQKLGDEGMTKLVRQTLEGEPRPEPPPAKVTEQDLAGLDTGKLRARITEEAMKNGGSLTMTPNAIGKWMQDAGMSEERIKSMNDDEILQLFLQIQGNSNSRVASANLHTPDIIIQQNQQILSAVKPVMEKFGNSIVSMTDDGKQVALGTIVREDGLILTKYSEIAKARSLHARLADGRSFPAAKVRSFDDHDLALVKIEASKLHPAKIGELKNEPSPGSFVFSPGCGSPAPIVGQGVLSVASRSMRESGGYLGVNLTDKDKSIVVDEVIPNSPALKAGLNKGDRILSADGTAFVNAASLREHIHQLTPQSVVKFKVARGMDELTLSVTMGDRAKLPERQTHPLLSLGTEISEKRGGFPLIFQHDQPLKPQDCGGAILDLHGNVIGINIARAGRVDSYAIPAEILADLLKDLD
jgi:S1-C subfamily serine protease